MNKMSGFKKYQVWAERKHGQKIPNEIVVTDDLKNAERIAEELKRGFGYPFVYVLEIAEVWNYV